MLGMRSEMKAYRILKFRFPHAFSFDLPNFFRLLVRVGRELFRSFGKLADDATLDAKFSDYLGFI